MSSQHGHSHPPEGHHHPSQHGHSHPPGGHHHGHGNAPEAGQASLPEARARDGERLLFVDPFSGLSGDMWVGALVDLGVAPDRIERGLEALALQGFRCEFSRVHKHGIAATRFSVQMSKGQPQRDYAAIRALLECSTLAEPVKELSLRAFATLAAAESQVHGVPVERVHFHEVGAVDSIVDVVAAAIGLAEIDATVCSAPIPVSRGFVRTQHGPMPLPAPATLLCLTGVPTYGSGLPVEMVTPTGACLLKTAAQRFTSWPDMIVERVGYGAGTRDLDDRPNLLRLMLGSPHDGHGRPRPDEETLLVLSANVDDMSPEWVAYALLRAQEVGAVDTWATPIVMKKGRPGFILNAMVSPSTQDAVAASLLNETSSLGLRTVHLRRRVRPRRLLTVPTAFGDIQLKVAHGDGCAENVAPEFESCSNAAQRHGVPLKQVYAAALSAYLQQTRPAADQGPKDSST